MLFDSITLAQGADITNMIVPQGTVFPDASTGELFYNTDTNKLYAFNGTSWIPQLDSTTSIASLLPNVVTANTYKSVTVDSTGRVTAGTNPTTIAGYGITDAQPLDADLTAISAISGTSGLLKKTASDTWALDANTYITGNQSITLSNDLTGSGTTSISATLTSTGVTAATYGSASTIPAFTVDAKGRISSASSLDISLPSSAVTAHQTALTITEAQITDGAILARNAGNETISGVWTFSNSVSVPSPTLLSQPATKQYVDNAVLGLIWKHPADVATTVNITLSGIQTIDGVSATAGFRVLVKNQTNPADNGVYDVVSGAWTRATDFDQIAPIDEINSASIFVSLGTTQANSAWTQTATVTAVGTSPITFVQFAGSGSFTAGTGLALTGNVFSNSGVLSTSVTTPITNAGTSINPNIGISAATTSAPGSMSAADKAKLDGIASNATANTGTVTSVVGTGTVSGLTLSGTVSTSGNLTLGGTLAVTASNFASQTANTVLIAPNGTSGAPTFRALDAADIPTLNQSTTGNASTATKATNIAGGVVGNIHYQSAADTTATLANGTSGYVLISGGVGAVPAWGPVVATSATTASSVTTGATDGTYELGWKVIPQNSQSAAYTTVLTDSGKHIFHPSADTTARVITIPANSSVAYPVGTALTFINQNGAGALTISITSDTMRMAGAGTTGSRTLAANGIATAIKLTATEWIISGTGLT